MSVRKKKTTTRERGFSLKNSLSKIFLKRNENEHRVEDLKVGDEMNFSSREAYNLLRTNIYFALPEREGKAHVIGLTSSCPQEGKSYTSINFAYTLAKDGKRVLLIDADMRKPSIARKLKVKKEPGFSNLLVNQTKEVVHKNVLTENLDLICAGDTPPNPSELLGSERMKEIVELFRDKYDYVIFDLPPVNIVSDALVISTVLDGIIVVVRHGYSMKKEVKECVGKLSFAKVHTLGYIYRGFSAKPRYYRKRSYQRYGYGYYDNEYDNE